MPPALTIGPRLPADGAAGGGGPEGQILRSRGDPRIRGFPRGKGLHADGGAETYMHAGPVSQSPVCCNHFRPGLLGLLVVSYFPDYFPAYYFRLLFSPIFLDKPRAKSYSKDKADNLSHVYPFRFAADRPMRCIPSSRGIPGSSYGQLV